VPASDSDGIGTDTGVDHGWVMNVTFVLAIVLGVPLVVVLSFTRPLPTWESWVAFTVRIGAVVWLCIALGVYAYARWLSST